MHAHKHAYARTPPRSSSQSCILEVHARDVHARLLPHGALREPCPVLDTVAPHLRKHHCPVQHPREGDACAG
eukprot:2631012-Pleurochrysis_carterae.AAC.1